jgi:hypothetical protein
MAPRIIRSAIRGVAGHISFDTALQISKILLHAQGFGSGADPRGSGEHCVFTLLNNDQPTLFDVGGHVPGYTAAFLDRFPGGQAYLSEPSAAQVSGDTSRHAHHIPGFFYFFSNRTYSLYIIRPRGDLVRIAKYEEALEQYQTSNFAAILKGLIKDGRLPWILRSRTTPRIRSGRSGTQS